MSLAAACLVAAFALGLVTGAVTGILPGLHVNVVAALMAASAPRLAAHGIPPLAVAVFVVTVAIVHTLLDIVPTLFLGIPADEAYALLPGHRMVRQGRGIEALRLSVSGSWRGLVLSAGLVLALAGADVMGVDLLEAGDQAARSWMAWILGGLAVLLVVTDRHPLWAAAILAASGLLGLVVFAECPASGTGASAFSLLLPALTGLFGMSGLLLSLTEGEDSIPPQVPDPPLRPTWRTHLGDALLGTGGGALVGLLPAVGPANVATVLSVRWREDPDAASEEAGRRFLVSTSAINAADHVFKIAGLYLIGRARSGVSIAIGSFVQLTALDMLALIAVMLAAGWISMRLLMRSGPALAGLLGRLHHRALHLAVIAFLCVLVLVTTGPWGLVVLAAATCLGMVAPTVHVRRAQAMGMFLVPVILFYSGWKAPVVGIMGLDRINAVDPGGSTALASLGAILLSGALGASTYLAASRSWQRGTGTRRAAWAAVLAVATLAGCLAVLGPPSAAAPPPRVPVETFRSVVASVHDGDTVQVTHDGRRITLRLADIDCPELAQDFGHEARDETARLVEGREVTVQVMTRDRYGRSVAVVLLPDGRSVNRRLVESGLAWRFDRYCEDPEMERLQAEAREARRGLWSDTRAVPPWEFRHPSVHPSTFPEEGRQDGTDVVE